MSKFNKGFLFFLALTAIIFAFVFWGRCNQKGISSSFCAVKEQVRSSQPLVDQSVKNLQNSFAGVSDLVKPAVVNISTIHVIEQREPLYEFYFGDPFEEFFRNFFGQQPQQRPQRKAPSDKRHSRKFDATGSGVIINEKGYILTNEHVVRDASEIKVTLVDGDKDTVYKGEVIGKDARLDLAVIKIKPKGKIPCAVLGNSDGIRVGDWAIAVGSPFGLEQTVTVGIVSARRQSVSIEGRTYKELIQTDAAINQGNSGGPLVNIEGAVIGINTAIYSPMGGFVGVGFAIPINKAKEILDDLIHKGKVIRGWLGVEVRPVDEAIKRQFGLKKAEGVLVNNVFKDTPAEKGGMKRGDIILEVDGQPVKEVINLQEIISKIKPNKKTKLKILRDKKEQFLQIVIEEMPEVDSKGEVVQKESEVERRDDVSTEWLGIKVKTLTSSMAQELGLSIDERGVVIVEVESGSKAEEAGLNRGDCIRSINQQQVPDIKTFEQVIKNTKLSTGIVLDVNSKGRLIYISIVGE